MRSRGGGRRGGSGGGTALVKVMQGTLSRRNARGEWELVAARPVATQSPSTYVPAAGIWARRRAAALLIVVAGAVVLLCLYLARKENVRRPEATIAESRAVSIMPVERVKWQAHAKPPVAAPVSFVFAEGGVTGLLAGSDGTVAETRDGGQSWGGNTRRRIKLLYGQEVVWAAPAGDGVTVFAVAATDGKLSSSLFEMRRGEAPREVWRGRGKALLGGSPTGDVAVGQGGTVVVRLADGRWQSLLLRDADGVSLCRAAREGQTIFVSDSAARLWRSLDGGTMWRQMSGGVADEESQSVARQWVVGGGLAVRGDRLVLASAAGDIIESRDQGSHWLKGWGSKDVAPEGSRVVVKGMLLDRWGRVTLVGAAVDGGEAEDGASLKPVLLTVEGGEIRRDEEVDSAGIVAVGEGKNGLFLVDRNGTIYVRQVARPASSVQQ